MKFIFSLLQLFLIFQVVLNLSEIVEEQHLTSQNNEYAAKLHKEDGNFCLWSLPSWKYLWSIETRNAGKAPYRLKMEDDGNLVLYDSTNKSCWSSNSANKGQAPYSLKMQNDGNLVIYDNSSKAVWASGTNGRK